MQEFLQQLRGLVGPAGDELCQGRAKTALRSTTNIHMTKRQLRFTQNIQIACGLSWPYMWGWIYSLHINENIGMVTYFVTQCIMSTRCSQHPQGIQPRADPVLTFVRLWRNLPMLTSPCKQEQPEPLDVYLKYSRSTFPSPAPWPCRQQNMMGWAVGVPLSVRINVRAPRRSCCSSSRSCAPCLETHTHSELHLWVCKQPRAHNIFKACKHFLLTLEYAARLKCSRGQFPALCGAPCSRRGNKLT